MPVVVNFVLKNASKIALQQDVNYVQLLDEVVPGERCLPPRGSSHVFPKGQPNRLRPHPGFKREVQFYVRCRFVV